MKVLLVEDDAQLRTGYALYLEREGWGVEQTAKPQPSLFWEQPFALAIVDAGVMCDDGRPLWRCLAERSKRPILALALSLNQEDELRQARLPNLSFLIKPFSLRSLAHMVRDLTVQREVA